MKINTILNKEISSLKMLLSLSFAAIGYCIMQLQNQNLHIKTLLETNNSLIASIEEMQQNLGLLEQKNQFISNPEVINTASDIFLEHPWIVLIGALTVGGLGYYASTVIVSKVSISTLKFSNLTSLLAKLPFFIQEQTHQVHLGDLIRPVTIFIKILGDNVQGIEFSYEEEDDRKSIRELFNDLDKSSGQETIFINIDSLDSPISRGSSISDIDSISEIDSTSSIGSSISEIDSFSSLASTISDIIQIL